MEKVTNYRAPVVFMHSPYRQNSTECLKGGAPNNNNNNNNTTTNNGNGGAVSSPVQVNTESKKHDGEEGQALSTSPITVQPRYRLHSPRQSGRLSEVRFSTSPLDGTLSSPPYAWSGSSSYHGDAPPRFATSPSNSAQMFHHPHPQPKQHSQAWQQQQQPMERSSGARGVPPYPPPGGGCSYAPAGFSMPPAFTGSMTSSFNASLARSPAPENGHGLGSPLAARGPRGPGYTSPMLIPNGTPPYPSMDSLSLCSPPGAFTPSISNNNHHHHNNNHVSTSATTAPSPAAAAAAVRSGGVGAMNSYNNNAKSNHYHHQHNNIVGNNSNHNLTRGGVIPGAGGVLGIEGALSMKGGIGDGDASRGLTRQNKFRGEECSNISGSSASSIRDDLSLCPNDGLCTLINDRKHQRKNAHTCRLFPCYHGHVVRHAKLFRHAPGQIAQPEGLETANGGRAKLSVGALASVNFSSISPEAPNAYKIIVTHRDESYGIFGDWQNVRVHTFKRYLHQVFKIPPTSQVLILAEGEVPLDDDIEAVGHYGVQPDAIIELKRKEDDEPPRVPLEDL